jgi:hypothetical protein
MVCARPPTSASTCAGAAGRPDEVRTINVEVARTATKAVAEAHNVVANARRALRSLGERAPTVTAQRVAQNAAQTRRRVDEGVTADGATRLVSLHDPDADALVLVPAIERAGFTSGARARSGDGG